MRKTYTFADKYEKNHYYKQKKIIILQNKIKSYGKNRF